jgi:hypothetical protein
MKVYGSIPPQPPFGKSYSRITSHRGLDEKLGIAASATPIPCLESPKAK